MSDSIFLGLPFLEAAQAQKHVTVNEALRRLDAALHLAVIRADLATPPETPDDGARYIIAGEATGDWAGHESEIAAWVDGVWLFLVPLMGWRAYDANAEAFVWFDGEDWSAEPTGTGAALLASPYGAATAFHVLEGDHTLSAGATNDTSFVIPERAIVLGVTGRVLTAITGPTSWTLGVAADTGRYGTGIGVGEGSTLNGPSGPVTYWSDTPLRLAATGSDFTGGEVRLAIHYMALTGPEA
jgi:hypothetical protein